MKLLLHTCCAPCSVIPINTLIAEDIEFEGIFFNPNIHPIDEFKKRMETADTFFKSKNIKINFFHHFKQNKWEAYKHEKKQRCEMCYFIRLKKTVLYAVNNGFDAFTTTLLISPYQNHKLIKDIAESLSKKHNITFYYKDFRPKFREGQQISKELGLYRQKYCGCILSKNNI